MNDNQAICIKCGVLVGNGNSYCANCGHPVNDLADVCVSCGTRITKETVNTKNHKTNRPLYGFFFASLILSVLTIIFLCIPNYFVLHSSYSYKYFYYSFAEWLPGSFVLSLVLLLANPTISFICSKSSRNLRFIKIIISLVLLIFIFLISAIEIPDNFGPMFALTVLLILPLNIILSIVETIVSAISIHKSK